MTALTDADRQILDFEATRWNYSGAKEQAVRDMFDCTATVYYQRLNAIIERPEALAYNPTLVKRLLRRRSARAAVRARRAPSG